MGFGGVNIPVNVEGNAVPFLEEMVAAFQQVGTAGQEAMAELTASAKQSDAQFRLLESRLELLTARIQEDAEAIKMWRANLLSAQEGMAQFNLEKFNAELAANEEALALDGAAAQLAAADLERLALAYGAVGRESQIAAQSQSEAAAFQAGLGVRGVGVQPFAPPVEDVAVAAGGIGAAVSQLSEAGSELLRLGTRVRQTGMNITMGLGVPLLAVGGFATYSASKFQTAMELIFTSAGASQQEVKSMSLAVLDLAQTAPQGPNQLATALFHLESVGLRGAQALDALKAASMGAVVGQADLESVSNALAGALVSGVEGAQSASQAMATLVAIAGVGNMRMQELASSLGTFVLPAARSIGVSLTDVGAAMAVMTDSGKTASEAGTALRFMFNSLASPTEKTQKIFESIGLTQLEVANKIRNEGLLPGLTLLLGKIQEFSSDPTVQRGIEGELFGPRSGAGAIALFQNLDRYQQKLDAINSSSSVSDFQKKNDEMMKQFSQQWGVFVSRIEVDAIRLGNVVMPIASKFLDILEPALTKLVNLFDSLDPRLQMFILGLAALGVVIGPILVFAGALISSLGVVVTALGAVASAFGLVEVAAGASGATAAAALIPVIAPILAIVGILVAIGVAAYILWDQWDNVTAGMARAWAALPEYMGKTWSAVLTYMASLMPSWSSTVISHLVAFANYVSGTIWEHLRVTWSNTWESMPGMMKGPLETMLGAIGSFVKNAIGMIADGFSSAFGWIEDKVSNIADAVKHYAETGSYSGGSDSTNLKPDMYGPPTPKRVYDPKTGKLQYYDADGNPIANPFGDIGKIPYDQSGKYGMSPDAFTPPVFTPDMFNPEGGTLPDISGGADKLNKTEFGLLSLSEAFKIFTDQTNSESIPAFKAWLEMEKKLSDATDAQAIKTEEATNPMYGMIMALGAIRTHIIEANETIGTFLRDEVYKPALSAFKSALSSLFSQPTKEGQALELQLLQAQRQKLLDVGGSKKRLEYDDKQIAAIQYQIDLLGNQNAIVKLQNEMKDKTVLAEQELLNQANIIGDSISQTSTQVQRFNDAAFFLALTAINLGNALNEQATGIRASGGAAIAAGAAATGSGGAASGPWGFASAQQAIDYFAAIGGNATGGPAGGWTNINEGSSGSTELVKLPTGSYVIKASDFHKMQSGSGGWNGDLNLTLKGESRQQIKDEVMKALDNALVGASFGGSYIGSGSYSPNG